MTVPLAEPAGPVPSDPYSRYRACAAVLSRLLSPGTTVLDAGSGESALLSAFLPGVPVTYVDPLLEPGEEGAVRRIRGDVHSPALDGRTFGYAVCIDVLEHVPPAERERFLRRLSSLAGEGILLTFPACDAGEGAGTDAWVGEAYRAAFGVEHRWLVEHRGNGLPSLAAVTALLASLGWRTRSWGHGHAPFVREYLPFFLASLEAEALRPEAEALWRHFNARLCGIDALPPFYRQVVLATREEAPEGIEAWPGPVPSAAEAEEERRRFWAIAAALPAGAKRLEAYVRELEASREELRLLKGSKSWRVTAPLRRLLLAWKGLRG